MMSMIARRMTAVMFLLTAMAAAQEEKISIKVNVPKDDVRWFTLASKSTFGVDSGMGVLEFQFDLKSDLSMTMTGKAEDGSHEFELKIVNVKGTAVDPMAGGEPVEIDSTKPVDKDDFVGASAAKRYLKVVNKRFKLVLAPSGRLSKLEPLDKVAAPGMPMAGLDPLDVYVRTLRDSFEMVPAEAFTNGETKDISEPINLMMFKATAKGKRKVEKSSAEEVALSMSAKIDGAPTAGEESKESERDMAKDLMSKMTFEESAIERKAVINRKDGVLSSSETAVKAVIAMPNQFGGEGDMSVTVDVKNTLKRGEAPKAPAESQPTEKK